MWKHFIADYLSFTKRDRVGILLLVSGIVFLTALPFFYPYLIKSKVYDHASFEKAIASLKMAEADSLASKQNHGNNNYKNYKETAARPNNKAFTQGELFYFDPNTASAADWKRLGIRDNTIETIRKYLSKGGRFYKKEDIGKIWGLHKDEAERLLPYIKIGTEVLPKDAAENVFKKAGYKKAVNRPSMVDINKGDTAAFIALPGIGSKLSQRIINFREKLGGFYKVEQVGETFGLPDSTFQKIKGYLEINNPILRQFNINIATIDEMKAHPYIRFALANAIVQYRNQHGNYRTVEDIKKIMTVTAEIFNKIAPYLSIQ
jgi:competence protein ComEA